MAFLLNLPWTLVGLIASVLSVPRGISLHHKPFAFVVRVRSFWWYTWLPMGKGARAMAVGNVVLLGPAIEERDLEHELVHVEQFEREPFWHVFPMWWEKIKNAENGARYSKYEDEAYRRARNVYKGETRSLVMARAYLGKSVEVMIDRPLGSKHPKHGFVYEANYGNISGTKAPDGEELDAYYLGVTEPLERATGVCIAIIHRLNDDDDKLVVVPEGTTLTDEEIASAVRFQEQWFVIEIVR